MSEEMFFEHSPTKTTAYVIPRHRQLKTFWEWRACSELFGSINNRELHATKEEAIASAVKCLENAIVTICAERQRKLDEARSLQALIFWRQANACQLERLSAQLENDRA